eukprot:Skav227518  [mRNA]  locus=scaffold2269:55742:56599:- [translate_table: standard]
MSTSAFRSFWAKPFGPSCHKETDYALIRSSGTAVETRKLLPSLPERTAASYEMHLCLRCLLCLWLSAADESMEPRSTDEKPFVSAMKMVD